MKSNVSRRDLLRVAAGAALMGGCGFGRTVASAPVGSFGGAHLRAIMKTSFVDDVAALTRSHRDEWATDAQTSLDLTFADDHVDRVTAVVRQHRGEDMAELDGSSPHEHADRLVDLSDIADELGSPSGGWLDVARDSAVVDGVWRAIPWVVSSTPLNYRPSVLDAAGVGVPTTFDELLEAATVLREQRLPLSGLGISRDAQEDSGSLAYTLLWSFGGHEVDESGTRVALDSAATRAALKFWKDLVGVSEPRSIVFVEEGNNDAFLDGEISMTQNGPSILWRAGRDGLDVAEDIGLSSLPAGPAGRHQWVGVSSLGVFGHSRNVEAAKDWIRFLSERDRVIERAGAWVLPALKGYDADPAMPWARQPRFSGMNDPEVVPHRPGWPGPTGREAELVARNQTVVKMFEAVGRGTASIDRAVITAASELARVYET